ncbi:hypothetical protein QR685DRAFT_436418, partial [Neurospora intermedia]
RLNAIADPVWLTQNNDHDFPTGSSYTQVLHRLVAVELSLVQTRDRANLFVKDYSFRFGCRNTQVDMVYIIHRFRQFPYDKLTHHEENIKRAILSEAMPEPKTQIKPREPMILD